MRCSRTYGLPAQMRQPGCSIYKDFDRTTFADFLDTLLDRDNFNFYKEVEGRAVIWPCWSFLSQLRTGDLE